MNPWIEKESYIGQDHDLGTLVSKPLKYEYNIHKNGFEYSKISFQP